MKPIYLLVASFSLFVACTSNDPEPGLYDEGIFVLNEGNFGKDNSSLSFISKNGDVTFNVFTIANSDQELGDVAQSIYQAEGKIFVIVNNSNVIYALNEEDMTIAYTITQTILPRYMTHVGNIGYFTEWVSFTSPGQLKSFNITTGNLIDSVTVGYGAEFPLIADNLLYVSNTFESTVSILNLSDLTITKTIPTPSSPGQMMTTDTGIKLICGGGYDENYTPLNDGAIVTISGETISDNITLEQNVTPKMALSSDKSIGYFFSGKQVYKVNLTTGEIFTLIINTDGSGFYGIATANDGTLYLGDHAGFQGVGKVLVYNPSGELQETFTVGIAPNGFLFR